MLTLARRDLGVDCDYVASAASVEEVKNLILAHSRAVHSDLLKAMRPEQKAEYARLAETKINVG